MKTAEQSGLQLDIATFLNHLLYDDKNKWVIYEGIKTTIAVCPQLHIFISTSTYDSADIIYYEGVFIKDTFLFDLDSDTAALLKEVLEVKNGTEDGLKNRSLNELRSELCSMVKRKW